MAVMSIEAVLHQKVLPLVIALEIMHVSDSRGTGCLISQRTPCMIAVCSATYLVTKRALHADKAHKNISYWST